VAIQNLNGSSSRNVFLDANRGIHPDCQAIHRFATGTGFGTTYQTVWDDGGGIYTVVGSYIATAFNDGSIVRGNIVTNGIGATAGTSLTQLRASDFSDTTTIQAMVSYFV